MRAAIIKCYGSPQVLQVIDDIDQKILPIPRPGPGQVLIKVKASSVNPVDWKARRGELFFIMSPLFPKILGRDVAGVVAEVGQGVRRFRPGDEVWALLDVVREGGGYAEYALARESTVDFKPANLTFNQAAAVPLAGLTAWQAIHQGSWGEGKRALVWGASGGVGHFAVQILKAKGSFVVAATSEGNFTWVKELGADHVFNYKLSAQQAKWAESPVMAQGPHDLIIDAVGKKSFRQMASLLTSSGTYVTTLPSFANGPALLRDFLVKWLHPRKVTFPRRKAFFIMVKSRGEQLAHLRELCEKGKLRPYIDRVYHLSQIQEAHSYGELGRTRGKVVIDIGD